MFRSTSNQCNQCKKQHLFTCKISSYCWYLCMTTQKRDVQPMLVPCWADVGWVDSAAGRYNLDVAEIDILRYHGVTDSLMSFYPTFPLILCFMALLSLVSPAPFGALVQCKQLPAWKVKDRAAGSIAEVACSASDRQGPNFASCVWREVSTYSSPSSGGSPGPV